VQELSDQQLKQMLLAYMMLIMKARSMKEDDLDAACEVCSQQQPGSRQEQGGLLSQEDLARLLFTDARTIRRDVQGFRKVEVCPAIECRDTRERYRQPRKKERRAQRTPILRAGRAGAENVDQSRLQLPVDDGRPESIRARSGCALMDLQSRADRSGQCIERREIAGRP
jgi:hypothetical protein